MFEAWISTPERDALSASDVHQSVDYRPMISELADDTVDYPPTHVLPIGVAGGERQGGAGDKQEPRNAV